MPTTVRLLMPIRSGKEVIPENAVLDCAEDVAEELLGSDPPCAEETDAVERYPNVQLLTHVDEFPVTGSEKFPLKEGDAVIIPQAMFQTETDRKAINRARAQGPILIPADQSKGDQASRPRAGTAPGARAPGTRAHAPTAQAAEPPPEKPA